MGKPRDAALAASIRDYEARAARYWPLEVVEVREEPSRGASRDVVMRKEGERLLGRLPAGARLLLCDPPGGGAPHDWLDSEAFAAFMQERREAAQDVAFVLGGAHGIGEVVRARPHRRLGLAPWTLPHELARLVLAEQLYRAGSIVRGEPYHK